VTSLVHNCKYIVLQKRIIGTLSNSFHIRDLLSIFFGADKSPKSANPLVGKL